MEVRKRPQKSDSAEVYIGDEFIGVIFRDDEDGELSYNFSMAIFYANNHLPQMRANSMLSRVNHQAKTHLVTNCKNWAHLFRRMEGHR
ncbi:DUF3126 family protein [Nordella sp. HKS 07]|nr:DUF3126 family protein [Nordella sp. HKS 07]